MSFEKEVFNCNNYLVPSVCNPWILNNMPSQSDESKQDLNKDAVKANEICAKCEHFTPKEKTVS